VTDSTLPSHGREPAAAGQVLPVDRYHTGVRFATLALWFVVILLFYLLGHLLFGLLGVQINGGSLLVLVVGAILVAQPVARWGEKQLVARWTSGRSVHLEAGALTLREKSGDKRIDLRQKVNYWRWQFVIRGRRAGRIPNGHYCAAVRLTQNDTTLSVYTFLPPKAAEALGARYRFYDLRGSSDKDKPSLGGRDALYLAAEHARWDSGAEIDAADFETLLKHLAAAVPEFATMTAG
jgi:hypothetical protein